jgi:hypothetical protein
MKFEDVLPFLKEGKLVKRNHKHPIFIETLKKANRGDKRIKTGNNRSCSWTYRISAEDLLEDDWEVINEI